MLATPKGVPTPPPQGQNSVFTPCGGFLPQKRKTCGLPGFAKPWADQCLNPPALLTAMNAPQAFGIIGDFPLGIAEEIPVPVSVQILTSSLVFWGRFTPCFSADFRPVSGFHEAGGILTLPQRKKRYTGATAAFTGFTQCWWYVFYKCVFSCKSEFRKYRNGFSHLLSDAFQLHSRDRKIYFRCRLRLCHTSVTEKEMRILPQAQRLFRFYHTYHT